MKKRFLFIALALICFLIFSCVKKIIVEVDGKQNCIEPGDWHKALTIELTPGVYEILPKEGAISFISGIDGWWIWKIDIQNPQGSPKILGLQSIYPPTDSCSP